MSTTIPPSSQKRLLRLISALTDMDYASRSFERFKRASDEGERYDFFLSMVVAYCRPFTENHGLGRLFCEYPKFPDFTDADLNLRHKRMNDLRNKLLSHSSLEGTKVHLSAPGAISPASGQTVVGYGYAVEKLEFLHEQYTPWLHDLVVKLSERLRADIRTLADAVGSKHLRHGETVILDTGIKPFEWTR